MLGAVALPTDLTAAPSRTGENDWNRHGGTDDPG